MATTNELWAGFHRGEKQNSAHYHSYCKGCVTHHEAVARRAAQDGLGHPAVIDIDAPVVDKATEMLEKREMFESACIAAGSIRGVRENWITHLLGGRGPGRSGCMYASEEIKAMARAHVAKRDGIDKATQPQAAASASSASKRDRSGSNTSVAAGVNQPKKAKQVQLKTYGRYEMPFGKAEKAAIEAQSLRAVVSANLPFRALRDPEMLKLFGMLRQNAPEIIPSRKVISGRLLNEAAAVVGTKLENIMEGKDVGLSTDGWKSLNKDSINAVCVNVNHKSYMIELVEATENNKDGPSLCQDFAEMIDRIEAKYLCRVLYLTTDADGGSKKGRVLLGKEREWLITPSCWAHQYQLILGDYFKVYDYAARIAEEATTLIGWLNNHGKVRKIMDKAQAKISADRNYGMVIVLTYLVANLTRWTTHCVAFIRLLAVKEGLQLAVMESRGAITKAQVGAAKIGSAENERLTVEARFFCDRIADQSFWSGLEHVVEDIEPICYGTNINQKDSTRADQVFLSIIGMFLRFNAHPEEDIAHLMKARLERRWKDCDQSLFILALILNPFEGLSRFGPDANLNHFRCNNMLINFYRRVKARRDNLDTEVLRTANETEVSRAFFEYLTGTGPFDSWREEKENYVNLGLGKDPIAVWTAYLGCNKVSELAKFAILLFTIVVNSAGCERVFSDLKVKQTQRRNRLKLDKLDKMAKVGADIKTEHQRLNLIPDRAKRSNHKSTTTLLDVPEYEDLLADQDDEDEAERGHLLVSSVTGWRTQMASWIADARRAALEEEEEDYELPVVNRFALRSQTLAALFGEVERTGLVIRLRIPQQRFNEEAAMMEALANAEENDNSDDDGDLIGSDDD